MKLTHQKRGMRYAPLFIFLFSANTFGSDLCEPHPELDFFNSISAVLDIELSEEAKPIDHQLYNKVSTPSSKILKLTLKTSIYNKKERSFRPLTKVELNNKAFDSNTVVLGSESGQLMSYSAANGKYFTTQELISMVELTELKTRGNTDWFGGIDVHHIYFEGLDCEKGVWLPYWGS